MNAIIDRRRVVRVNNDAAKIRSQMKSAGAARINAAGEIARRSRGCGLGWRRACLGRIFTASGSVRGQEKNKSRQERQRSERRKQPRA